MTEVTVKKRSTAFNLVNAIEEFISDNDTSNDVRLRWLAAYMAGDPLRAARQSRNGSLDPDLQQLVNSHRIAEIEKAKDKSLQAIANLDREASALAREISGAHK